MVSLLFILFVITACIFTIISHSDAQRPIRAVRGIDNARIDQNAFLDRDMMGAQLFVEGFQYNLSMSPDSVRAVLKRLIVL